MTPTLGLPEGVELIDFNATGPEDFEIMRHGDTFHIYKGTRHGAGSGGRVKPAKGYKFVQVGFEQVTDIKAFKVVDGRPLYAVTKAFDAKTIEATITFTVEDEHTLEAITAALAELDKLPGFVTRMMK